MTDHHPDTITISFAEPRTKPDHDPHGEVNPHLSSWSCPNCGTSGFVVTHDLDMVYSEMELDEESIRCEACSDEA